MEIIEIRALRGPNYYSRHPVIFMKLDLKELELKPTDLIPNFKENISLMIPTLYKHKCSVGSIGGFYERLIRGTWAGHVVEHVALELQCLAGDEVAFGKTFDTDETGIYNIVYRYLDEDTGLRAGEISVSIIEKLFKGIITEVGPFVSELKSISKSNMLGPSTRAIVNEAKKRGIEHIRLNEDSYVQLGEGIYQRRIQATVMDNTSALGVEIASDKARTKSLLHSMGIPVVKGISVTNKYEVLQASELIGYPLVVKPLSGNHGRGITTNISNQDELIIAFTIAQKISETCIVEKHLYGFDYRILVIDGKFVAAARREPAYIIGNGIDNIEDLIQKINQDPERGVGHENNLTKITIDCVTERFLASQNLTVKSIVSKGDKIYLKPTANISTGGTAEDVTDTIHPLNQLMAERISKILNLNVMGIDIIASSLDVPLKNEFSGVLEVNASPGFRMHLNPTKGNYTNVASNVVDMLFPTGSNHTVPIVSVTGTNGKTTTTRLITHILAINKRIVGMTSTDAVVIDNVPILMGDYSGPEGALKVMMDSSIDHAVLEVARGGILRRGLGYKESDIGVLLNISSDHLGEGDINTLEELARLKSTVTEAVKPSGYAIFNADDPLVVSCIGRTKANPILFSQNPENKELKNNYEKGNWNVVLVKDTIIIQKEKHPLTVANIMEIPITFNGKAKFNIENVLAAVAATSALGLTVAQIRKGIMSFNPSLDQCFGRMNCIDVGDFKVLIDYGHNPGAIIATGDFISDLMPGRKIRMTSSAGNRKTENILEYGVAISKYYDYVIVCDSDPRQRVIGETAEIVKQGLINGGLKTDMVKVILDEREATKAALEIAKKGDLLVLQADNISQVIEDVLEYKKRLKSYVFN